MPTPDTTPDPWATRTADDLWSALVAAVADSDAEWDDLQDFAVRAGFLVACPTCAHTVRVGAPVGPCECCEDDDDPDAE